MSDFFGIFSLLNVRKNFLMSITADPDVPSSERQYEVVRTSQNVIPVSVKQVTSATQENNQIMIDGVRAVSVRLIGVIQSVDRSNIDRDIYIVSDGSGTVEVHHRVEDAEKEPFETNIYVAASGSIKFDTEKNEYYLEALYIEKVTDHDRIAYHNLDVIHAHLYATHKGFPPNTVYTSHREDVVEHEQAQTETKAASEEEINDAVHTYIKNVGNAKISEIISHLKDKYPVEMIHNAIERLSLDGLIYNLDEDTVAST